MIREATPLEGNVPPTTGEAAPPEMRQHPSEDSVSPTTYSLCPAVDTTHAPLSTPSLRPRIRGSERGFAVSRVKVIRFFVEPAKSLVSFTGYVETYIERRPLWLSILLNIFQLVKKSL